MKLYKYVITCIFLILFLFSCDNKKSQAVPGEVKYSGALKSIMSGHIEATISLDTLVHMQHLYALGAVENLKGEIQVFDHTPSNSFVIDSILKLEDSYNIKASLLVYAEVDAWNTFEMEDCKTQDDLEVQIFKYAINHGIDIEKPFPFLLEGTVASLDWHVINWDEDDTVHTPEKHQESGLHGTISDRSVTILGFYSTKHKAIFTHHSTNIHMHFKTDDQTIAGHVDNLILEKTIKLSLPKL